MATILLHEIIEIDTDGDFCTTWIADDYNNVINKAYESYCCAYKDMENYGGVEEEYTPFLTMEVFAETLNTTCGKEYEHVWIQGYDSHIEYVHITHELELKFS